jgi:hypothetical protein
MADLHVDDFCADVARVLVRLYHVFPRREQVHVEDIIGAEEPDEFGMHSQRYMACLAAMVWLGEEGLIRYASLIRQEAIDQAELTGRLFTLLTLPAPFLEPQDVTDLPESVRLEHGSNVHRLRLALKSQSSTRLRKAVMDLLRQVHAV